MPPRTQASNFALDLIPGNLFDYKLFLCHLWYNNNNNIKQHLPLSTTCCTVHLAGQPTRTCRMHGELQASLPIRDGGLCIRHVASLAFPTFWHLLRVPSPFGTPSWRDMLDQWPSSWVILADLVVNIWVTVPHWRFHTVCLEQVGCPRSGVSRIWSGHFWATPQLPRPYLITDDGLE